MLINKIDNLQNNIDRQLDHQATHLDNIEEKVEHISDKLNEFEVQASTILTAHEIEIKELKLKLEKVEKEVEQNKEIHKAEQIERNWMLKIVKYVCNPSFLSFLISSLLIFGLIFKNIDTKTINLVVDLLKK